MHFIGRRTARAGSRAAGLTALCVAVAVAVGACSHGGGRTPAASAARASASAAASAPTAAGGGTSSPEAPTSPPPASAAVSFPARPPDGKPGPVILVPGYGGDQEMLGDLAAKLRAAGRTVSVLALPDDATGDFHDQERVLATAVTAALHGGAASVDLVGYSAGGIVVALYVAADPSHVRRVVNLASPLHGTKLAAFAASVAASACPAACQQMVPGNPVLASLAAAEPGTSGVPWRTIRSTHDSVVTPIESAEFSGAQNLELQAICADDDAGHTTIPQDPLAEGLTVQALDDPLPMPAPTSADCARLRGTA